MSCELCTGLSTRFECIDECGSVFWIAVVVFACLKRFSIKNEARSLVGMGHDAIAYSGSWSKILRTSLPVLTMGLTFLKSLWKVTTAAKEHVIGPVWDFSPIAGPTYRNNIRVIIANQITNKILDRIANKINIILANWIVNRIANRIDSFLFLYDYRSYHNTSLTY